MELHKIMLLVLSLILFPATMPALGMDQEASVLVHKSDDGKEIVIHSGGILVVSLEQTGGTGYAWQINNLDAAKLELVDSSSEPLKTDKQIVGGPMLMKWRLKAVGSGETELTMYYYRVWEGIDKAIGKFRIKIRII